MDAEGRIIEIVGDDMGEGYCNEVPPELLEKHDELKQKLESITVEPGTSTVEARIAEDLDAFEEEEKAGGVAEPKKADTGPAPNMNKNVDSPRVAKWKALYQARYIIAKYGTMPERQLCRKNLKRMEKGKLNKP